MERPMKLVSLADHSNWTCKETHSSVTLISTSFSSSVHITGGYTAK